MLKTAVVGWLTLPLQTNKPQARVLPAENSESDVRSKAGSRVQVLPFVETAGYKTFPEF